MYFKNISHLQHNSELEPVSNHLGSLSRLVSRHTSLVAVPEPRPAPAPAPGPPSAPARRRSDYYSSEVRVEPLTFSDTNYARNYITESLFAGSIHRGLQETDTLYIQM